MEEGEIVGMFDYLKCHVPLPDTEEVSSHEFQTKSLRNLMDRYEIRADGTLWREHVDGQWVNDESHFLGGYLNEIEETRRWLPVSDVHQDIIFYTGWKKGVLREYAARFTDGQLIKITYKDVHI